MRVAARGEPRGAGRSARGDHAQPPRFVSRRAQEVRRAGRAALFPDAGLHARDRLPRDRRTARISRHARRDGAEARRARVPGQGRAHVARDVSRDVSESPQVADGQGRRRSRQPVLVEPVAQAWDDGINSVLLVNRVLILGATSPIARALALRFAFDGARLYLATRNTEEARRVAEDVSVRAGVPALSGTFDASDFASHDEFIRDAATQLGGLDGVVVCFGTLGDEDVAQTDPGEALATIHQNFTGAVSLITLAARHLEQQRSGFIIVIGSVAGERGRKKNYVYGSAKGALATFAQGLRGRLAVRGGQVMTAELGTVDTRSTWGREGALLTITPTKAADLIYSSYRKRAEVVYVPWFWRLIMGAIRLIPESRFKRVSF